VTTITSLGDVVWMARGYNAWYSGHADTLTGLGLIVRDKYTVPRTIQEGEIRILLYGHYRIAYIITDDFIDILGVFHGALQIERYLT